MVRTAITAIRDFLIVLIAAALIWLCVELQHLYNSNWCAAEIDIMKDHISDLWYLNNLDEVDIQK
tara:strand:+ start:4123 stop:4317 length:195 start_codon:yes stop_codon:yes gene_type:complete